METVPYFSRKIKRKKNRCKLLITKDIVMKNKFLVWTKILSFFAVTMFVFSACEGPVGPPGRDGYDGYDGKDGESTRWKILNLTVQQNHWQWDNVDECYFYEFPIPELTEFVVEDGAVLAQALLGSYRPLAFTAYYYDTGAQMYYAETVSYEYTKGYIRFNVASSDLFDNTPYTYLPQEYNFKVTLMW